MRRSGALTFATGAAALALTVTACSDRQAVTEFEGGPSLLIQSSDVVPGAITLCKHSTDAPGYWVAGADLTVSATGGSLPAGASFHLNSIPSVDITSECKVIWQSTDANPQTVTITEDVTSGVVLEAIVAFVTNANTIFLTNPSNVFNIDVSDQVGAVVVFKNILGETPPPPPPPPPSCVGLTPGYWKNWRNHYTYDQFASLVVGTIGGTVAGADAIFATVGQNSSSAATKLSWFVLANQLTLNLVESGLPNPSGGDLDLTCVPYEGGPTLGYALTEALAILANPSAYAKNYILAVKDILDAIANLGDD